MLKPFPAALCATLLSTSALAADLALRPAYSETPMAQPALAWDSVYIGANTGYGRRHERMETGAATGAVRPNPYLRTFSSPMTFGGLQAGFTRQWGSLVYGAEIDAQLTDGRNRALSGPVPLGGIFGDGFYSARMSGYGTLRARLGYAFGDALFYVTAGGMLADVRRVNQSGYDAFSTRITFHAKSGDMQLGWTLGAGLEYKFAPNWSARAEYLAFALGRETIAGPATFRIFSGPIQTQTLNHRFGTTGALMRVGFNYHFNSAPAPAAAPLAVRY